MHLVDRVATVLVVVLSVLLLSSYRHVDPGSVYLTPEPNGAGNEVTSESMRRRTVPRLPAVDLLKAQSVRSHFNLSQRVQVVGLNFVLGLRSGWGMYGFQLLSALVEAPDFFPVLLRRPEPDCHEVWKEAPEHISVLLALVNDQSQTLQYPVVENNTVFVADYPVLHAIPGFFVQTNMSVWGTLNIGFVFIELERDISEERLARAALFDMVITGSLFVHDMLKSYRLSNVALIPQGVDTATYHPGDGLSRSPVVFAGGKFELRKGQDIVVDVFKRVLLTKPDTRLVVLWDNPFISSQDQLFDVRPIGHVKTLPRVGGPKHRLLLEEWLLTEGLPRHSFKVLPQLLPWEVAQWMRRSSAAIFLSRCEGGRNQVAVEALASGLAVVLSSNSGQLDVIHGNWCFPVTKQAPMSAPKGKLRGWGESSVTQAASLLLQALDVEKSASRRRAASYVSLRWGWAESNVKVCELLRSMLLRRILS